MDAATKLGLIRVAADLAIASIQKHPNGIPMKKGHLHPQAATEVFDDWIKCVRSAFETLDQPPK